MPQLDPARGHPTRYVPRHAVLLLSTRGHINPGLMSRADRPDAWRADADTLLRAGRPRGGDPPGCREAASGAVSIDEQEGRAVGADARVIHGEVAGVAAAPASGGWERLCTALVALLLFWAAGCASAPADLPPTVPEWEWAPSAAECAAAAGVPPDPAAEVVVLVVDNSASVARWGLPPAVVESLRAAQRDGLVLTILAVNGAGAPPIPVRTVALDPRPGRESVDALTARQIVLGCVPGWVFGPEATPSAEGSDLWAALAAAFRQLPRLVLVISDGVATAGAVDLNLLGYEPDATAVAAAASAAGVSLNPAGVELVWSQLGETAQGLPEGARDGLRALWSVLLPPPIRLRIDTRTAPPAAIVAAARVTGPADPIPEPVATRLALPEGAGCYRLPASLLFAPDSAELTSDAQALLAGAVAQLVSRPGWVATVSGHTADYGTPAGRRDLSEDRATAGAGLLLRLTGLPPDRVTAVGYGATRPLVPEWRDGVHDLTAAAANRRVEIVVHPTGSIPPEVCPSS